MGLLAWLAVGVALLLALGIRLYQIDEPPLDFQPERQLHGAILARWYYLETQDSAPLRERRVAERSARDEGIVGEPPIMEFVSAHSLEWPPEYFVVTNLAELDLQPDLRRVLERYPRVARTRDYVIYDLQS